MSMMSPILLLISAIGADIKSLRINSSVLSITGATNLIQTQRIMAQLVLKGQIK